MSSSFWNAKTTVVLCVALAACNGEPDRDDPGGQGGAAVGTASSAGGSSVGGQGEGGSGGAGVVGSGGGSGTPCDAFCAKQQACSDFPLEDCSAECQQTRADFDGTPESCRQAVDASLACMAEQACDGWAAAALASGSCGPALAEQLDVCGAAAYFAGWDACVSTCTHSVNECHVDVPRLSTWASYETCRSECILNKELDAAAGCLDESLAYAACEVALDCSVLQDHLNGAVDAAPACQALADAWAEACAF